MIHVGIKKVADAGSCNFCNRGVLNEDEPGLTYPYTLVYEVSSDQHMSPCIRFCLKCMEELKSSANAVLK